MKKLAADRPTPDAIEALESSATLDLHRYIPALLTFVSNKLSHGASEKYRRLFGVGISEWRVMAILAVEPGIPASRLCQVIGFDKALASRTVKSLAAEGLVTLGSDPRNSSRSVIALTPAGIGLHDRILRVVQKREAILHSAFSRQEIDTLVDLLSRLLVQADIVNAYEPETDAPGRAKLSDSDKPLSPRKQKAAVTA